jgi:hypothetical protein
MKTRISVLAAAAGCALLVALSACSTADNEGAAGLTAAGLTSDTADISEGVQPDPAAVALLPQSYKDKGELTVAMDLHYPPNVSEWTCTSQGKPAINGITLPNVQEALTQLASKRIDGIMYDTPALVWAQEQQPKAFTLLTPQVDTRTEHIVTVALKKGSPLTPALQAAVQSVLESPEYQKSLDNWGLSAGAIKEAKLN